MKSAMCGLNVRQAPNEAMQTDGYAAADLGR